MSATDESEVRATLGEFFVAMATWEEASKARYRLAKKEALPHENAKELSMNELREVFREYCTTWERPSRARFGAPYVSMKPTYGTELETIRTVHVENDNATVVTQQSTGARNSLVYRLVRVDGKWRIHDNRKRVDSSGQEVDWDL